MPIKHSMDRHRQLRMQMKVLVNKKLILHIGSFARGSYQPSVVTLDDELVQGA